MFRSRVFVRNPIAFNARENHTSRQDVPPHPSFVGRTALRLAVAIVWTSLAPVAHGAVLEAGACVPDDDTSTRAAWFTSPQQSGDANFSLDGGRLAGMPFVMPVDGARMTSPFGMRIHPGTRDLREHTGIDLAAPIGTPVKAAAPGTVEVTGFDKHGYGRYVVLQHAAGYSTWYAHLSAIAAHLRAGMQLHLGQRVGAVGRTGDATGPHLHFEVRYKQEPIDPLPLTRGRIAPALAGDGLTAFQRQIAPVRQLFELQLPQSRVATSGTADHSLMQGHTC